MEVQLPLDPPRNTEGKQSFVLKITKLDDERARFIIDGVELGSVFLSYYYFKISSC